MAYKSITVSIYLIGCNELKRCLVEEYRRLGFHISLSPIYEDANDEAINVNFDDVYTDLKVVSEHKKEEITLSSYKELFQSEGKQNRTIIVTGDAGVGKSTWCMKLVHTWTKAHESTDFNSDNTQNKCAKHDSCIIADLEKALAAFDFLFFVQLRYVEGISSIKDIIFSSLERLSHFQKIVHHIMNRYSEKVLIILDGLDEYALNLSYSGLNFCTVISTARPWKFDRVCTRNTKFDIVLKISGLDTNGVAEMAKKLLKVLNDQKLNSSDAKSKENVTPPSVDNFLENVRRTGMSDSVRVPLILLIMLEAYLEKGYLSSSRTCNLLCLLECLVIRGEQKLTDEEGTKLENMKEGWSKTEKSFNGFDSNETLAEYSYLLQKLARLAYEGLNRPDNTCTLVFSEKELSRYFSQDELQICLKFGLLSKSKQLTSFLTRVRVSLSFYHKLVQELFAALWVVNSSESFVQFMTNIKSIQDITEMENTIYFIYGTDSHLGSCLTKHMVALFNKDSIILQQRQNINCDIMLPWELHQMSSILLQCQEEERSNGQPNEPVYTSDISVFSISNSHSIDSFLELVKQSKTSLKSLFAQCVQFQLIQCQELLELISKSIDLETFVIIMPSFLNTANSSIELTDLELDFSKHHAFKNCYLVGRGQSTASGLYPLVTNLKSASNIVNLRLRNIGSECCNILTNVTLELKNLESLVMENLEFSEGNLILQNTKLHTIQMRNVTGNNSSVVLNSVYELQDVCIKFTAMQRCGWEDLFYELGNQPNLEKLVLHHINCVDGRLNLERCTRLEYLSLGQFSVSDIRIAPCKQLKVLEMRKIYLPTSPGFHESSTSTTELNIWQAALTRDEEIDVTCSDKKQKEVDSNIYSPEITESECDVAGIQESSFYYSDWGRILGSLPTDSLEEIMLCNLHIGNANFALGDCKHLKSVTLYQLLMSEESFRVLVSTLGGLTPLPELDIKELNVSGVIRELTSTDFQTSGNDTNEYSLT